MDECNTCGGTGRWESTLEGAPTTLVDLGECPDCRIRTIEEIYEAIELPKHIELAYVHYDDKLTDEQIIEYLPRRLV